MRSELLYLYATTNQVMYTYDTVTEAVNDLRRRGYSIDFNLEFDRIVCHETPVGLLPGEFEIVEVHRFEGNSNPDDEEVVYAIESKHGHKGIIVDAFGLYADEVSSEMVEKLRVRHPVKNS
jgi:hypothetical protein